MAAVAGLVAGCSAYPDLAAADNLTGITPTPKPRQRYWQSSIVGCYRAAPSSDGGAIMNAALPDIAPFAPAIRLPVGRTACLGRSGTGFVAGGSDIALGGDHGFLAEELDQGVNTDLGVGEFGGKRVAQPANTIHLGGFWVLMY
jgi:hypothetical protein